MSLDTTTRARPLRLATDVERTTSEPAGRRRPADVVRAHPRAVLASALAVVALLHLWNLNGWPVFFDDEGTYVAQAWATYGGDLAHYTYWYDHPPAGWLQLSALLAVPHLLGIEITIALARYAMVALTLVTCVLLYRLCLNLGMRRTTALIAMLLWGASPLVIFEGRQVMLDNITLPWLVGAFVLATSPRQALWRHVAAGLCFGIAVLTKETTVLIAPGLVLALWGTAYRPLRVFGLVGASAATFLTVLLYPMYAVVKHELLAGPGHVSIQDAVAFQLVSRAGSGALWSSGSDARVTLDGWLSHDSTVWTLGVLAGVVCLALPRLRCIGLTLAILVVVALRPGGYLPLMYVITVLPFAAVALAGVAEVAVDRLRSGRRGPGLPVAAVVVLALLAVAWSTVPTWTQGYQAALGQQANRPHDEAVAYVRDTLPRDTRIVSGDQYWNDLVNAGWSSDGWSGPIWSYKLDLDPVARDENLPDGWRDVDYLLSDQVLLDSLGRSDTPQLTAAFQASTVVASWGSGYRKVELRRVDPTKGTSR